MAGHDEVFPASHGSWITLETLDPSDGEIKLILKNAKFLLDQGALEFHSREVLAKAKAVSLERYNEFLVSGILRRHEEFVYLGRNVFTGQNSELGARTKIHDTIVLVLQREGKPLKANEIIARASKTRSIDPKMQIQPKPPILLLGQNFFGLDFWDPEQLKLP